jgi:hypothetical protein
MIEAPELKSVKSLRHGFFTREGGHSAGLFASLNCGFGSGDDKPTVARNRAAVGEQLGVSAQNLLTIWQWHSPDVIVADAPWDALKPPKGDAIVTNKPGLAIAVLTADCAPILFADEEAGVIAAAHAGWKGAFAGVSDTTIAVMEEKGARRERITAIIGPRPMRSVLISLPNSSPRLPTTRISSRPRRALAIRCSTCRPISSAACCGKASAWSSTWACAPIPTRIASTATAEPRIVKKETTAGRFRPSCCHAEHQRITTRIHGSAF